MNVLHSRKLLITALLTFMVSPFCWAESSSVDKYRELLSEGNPAELFVDEGLDLWHTPRGPKKATLEQCDLGLGPGVVKGAYAHMPRYFKDTNRVQDTESRLLTCMETLQGIKANDVIKGKWGKGERAVVEAIATYIASESNGMPIKTSTAHPMAKEFYDMGEKAFFFRAGPFDFACATCHQGSGKRIRLQGLPDLTVQETAAAGYGSWPAYRVANGQLWTMQKRINDCFRQQRFPDPKYTSDVTIALSMYMAMRGKGGALQLPGIKR